MGNAERISQIQEAILRFENGEIDVDALFSTLERNANALEDLDERHVREMSEIFGGLGDLDREYSGAELRAAIINELKFLHPILEDIRAYRP